MSSTFYLSKAVRAFCLQDYQVCWLAETIKVLRPFTFQRLQCLLSRLSQSSLHFQDYQSLLSCRDNQGHLLSLHSKDFNVFHQAYHSLLYFSKTSRVFCSKTIRVFCQDYNNLLYISKTIRVFLEFNIHLQSKFQLAIQTPKTQIHNRHNHKET